MKRRRGHASISAQYLPISRRSLLSGTCVVLGSIALPGCTLGAKQAAPSSSEAIGSVSLSFPTAPMNLDPAGAQDEVTRAVVAQVFNSLVTYDYQTRSLTYVTARSVTMAADAQSCTIQLGESTFSDGTPVRASDIARAWVRLISPTSSAASILGSRRVSRLLSMVSGYSELASGVATTLSGLSVIDDVTLQISLSRPYAAFPLLLTHPSLCAVPEQAESDAQGFGARPVGNGDYLVVGDYADGNHAIELSVRTERAASVDLSRVRIRLDEDPSDAFVSYQKGELDICAYPVSELSSTRSLDPTSASSLAVHTDVHSMAFAMPTLYYLSVNVGSEDLQDQNVRRGLSLAIDRDALCRSVLRDAAIAATGLLSPALDGYPGAQWACADYNKEDAIGLLDAVLPQGSDGVRLKNASLIYASDAGLDKVADRLVSDLAAVGITCKAEALKSDVLRTRLDEGSFSFCLRSWTNDTPAADEVIFALLHSASGASGSCSGFADQQIDAVIEAARSAASLDAMRQELAHAEGLGALACPVIPLFFPIRALVTSSRIGSLSMDPFGTLLLGKGSAAHEGE